MLSDVEIARNATPIPVARIAEKLGYSADELEPYGKFKAKVPLPRGEGKAKLILVTAMNPTPLGEGKTKFDEHDKKTMQKNLGSKKSRDEISGSTFSLHAMAEANRKKKQPQSATP